MGMGRAHLRLLHLFLLSLLKWILQGILGRRWRSLEYMGMTMMILMTRMSTKMKGTTSPEPPLTKAEKKKLKKNPGLYHALYACEPEGTAEMKLEEDQLMHVIGHGGGVGWAVVDQGGVGVGLGAVGVGVRMGMGGGVGVGMETVGHALVPESYLEVVRLDEDLGDGV
jgi:hypothetical protein